MLRDKRGRRKYLTAAERDAFIEYAQARGGKVGTFAQTMAMCGCRISEALELTAGQLDFAEQTIVFRSLKKRRQDVYRSVPVSSEFLADIRRIHSVDNLSLNDRLWPWCRGTGWSRIREIMRAIDVVGIHATPKGLRHAFGVAAVQKNIPLNVVQKWLGHSSIEMTAIYVDVLGDEERQFATRLWSTSAPRVGEAQVLNTLHQA